MINQEKQPGYGWVILIIFTLAQLLMSIGAYAWGPLAPFLQQELALSRTQIGLLTSLLYLTSVFIATPSGFLVDRWGAKIMLVICLGLMGASFVTIIKCDRYFILLFLAALAGLGYGILNQASVKGLMYWFTVKFRGTALGIKQAGVTLGGAIGAAVLPFLALRYNWQIAAAAMGFLMILMAGIAYAFYREKPSTLNISSFKEGPKQVSLKQVFKNYELLATLIVMPLLAGSQACLSAFLILYLKETLNFSTVTAGIYLTSAMVAGTVGRIGWGFISDHFFKGERSITLIIICFFALIGTIGIGFLPGTYKGLNLIYAVLLGLGFLGFHGVLMALVGELAGTELAGAVTGIVVTVSWAGIVVLPVAFGFLADHYGYLWAWLMVTLSALLGVITYSFTYGQKISLSRR